jgi:hypothetical protein
MVLITLQPEDTEIRKENIAVIKPKFHEVRESILLISKGIAPKSVCAY